jgi:hypothetical protein
VLRLQQRVVHCHGALLHVVFSEQTHRTHTGSAPTSSD